MDCHTVLLIQPSDYMDWSSHERDQPHGYSDTPDCMGDLEGPILSRMNVICIDYLYNHFHGCYQLLDNWRKDHIFLLVVHCMMTLLDQVENTGLARKNFDFRGLVPT